MFGTEFFNNALLTFTKFGYDKKSIHRREHNLEMSEDKVRKEYTELFERTFSFTLRRD